MRIVARFTCLTLTIAALSCASARSVSKDVRPVSAAGVVRTAIEEFVFVHLPRNYGWSFPKPPTVDVQESLRRVSTALRVEVGDTRDAMPRYPHFLGSRDSLVSCTGNFGTTERRCTMSDSSARIIEVYRVDRDSASNVARVWVALMFSGDPAGRVKDYAGEVIFRRMSDGRWEFEKIGRVVFE